MTDALPLEYAPDAPCASMILLHGLGASGDDLFPLAEQLGGGNLRVICPHASVRRVTLNGGIPMRAWYDIVGVDLQDRQDSAGVAKSAAAIEALIEAEKGRGFSARQIFVAGFSQGAAMALHVGLRHSESLAGIIALSGYLLFAEDLPTVHAVGLQTPIFQANGQYDTVVLPQWGRLTRDALKQADCTLEYREYAMMHAIIPDEIQDINQWLAKHI